MIRCRPVAYRANFSAASTASVPLLQKYTRSSPGALASSRSASRPGSSAVSNWTRSASSASSMSCSAWRTTGWFRPDAEHAEPGQEVGVAGGRRRRRGRHPRRARTRGRSRWRAASGTAGGSGTGWRGRSPPRAGQREAPPSRKPWGVVCRLAGASRYPGRSPAIVGRPGLQGRILQHLGDQRGDRGPLRADQRHVREQRVPLELLDDRDHAVVPGRPAGCRAARCRG